MQDPLLDAKTALSLERFAEYRKTAADDSEALARYTWNTRLCEALYPSLHYFEVALRNNLHSAISTRFPSGPWSDVQCWMDLTNPVLDEIERRAVNRAKGVLRDQGKPLEIGRMVAELNFGFWTSLLDVRYERSNVFWPHLLRPTFPRMPKTDRKRRIVSARINSIRLLRNRVSHHEPIWHWRDLKSQHDGILEALSWISSDLALLLRTIDRFEEVFHEGWNRYRTGVLG